MINIDDFDDVKKESIKSIIRFGHKFQVMHTEY